MADFIGITIQNTGDKTLDPGQFLPHHGRMVTDSFVQPGLSVTSDTAAAPPAVSAELTAAAELTVAEAIGLGVRGLIDRVLHGGPIIITRKSQPLIELRLAGSSCSCDRSTNSPERHS